ncbi:MAG: 4-hydroxyphenylacetate 3-monooxygenase [Gammaproteobacteria bacterium]|jgi:4-hydroxyphenylacetate 3-monooxygenase
MGARTGKQYVDGLRDTREVWVNGERVPDVTTHPRFAGSLQGMASYFDWQHRHAAQCLFEHPELGSIGVSHIIPRSGEDLERRHRGLERIARYSVGMLGRTPDYVNVTFAGFAGLRSVWTKNGDEAAYQNLVDFQKECAAGDLALTHTIVHPVVDRRVPDTVGVNRELALRKVGETKDSIIVSGSRLLATLAPFSDEIAVYPGTPVTAETPEMALSFSIPIATPGLKVLCRDHYGVDGNPFDRPFSAHFDEQDAFIIFDEVEVPKHRVFIDGDAEIYNLVRDHGWMPNIMQQTCIRAQIKFEFAYDLCTRMAKALGSAERPETIIMLGEIWSYAELVRAALLAAETEAMDWGDNTWFCSAGPFLALRPTIPQWMLRVNTIIKTIGSHNLLATPAYEDFNDPQLRPYLDTFLRGADIDAPARARLFRTAWDLAGSALGSRLELYEQFYLGSSGRNYSTAHRTAQQRDWTLVPEFFAASDELFGY